MAFERGAMKPIAACVLAGALCLLGFAGAGRPRGTGPAGQTQAAAPGPYQPSWDSLVQQYECPEWFRDAKFGIWAHWTAQCVPEQGETRRARITNQSARWSRPWSTSSARTVTCS